MKNTPKQQEIANTIISQINSLDRMALWAYGAKNYAYLGENETRNGGLQFQVNGLKHKGYVAIELTWSDEYTIIFYKIGKAGIKVTHKVEGIHFPELITHLDYIEGK